ncbi:MAG: site-specific DNA-methyltransferase [Chloroflexi bacterium]|nr:site-specific DNA-methyltransferase [Chloroflexota bacterium]
MSESGLPLNQILSGDAVHVMEKLPENSIDLIFADPPYNMQIKGNLSRPDFSRVDGVDDAWDKFEDYQAYDKFTTAWLKAAQRLLKPDGAIWVIGTYHNIYRVGKNLQDLGFWVINEIIWEKTNPMPNFRGVRFTNAHETLIWAKKNENSKYTINYHAMKPFNDGKQLRSTWKLPICKGKERIRVNGERVHSTQKPISLLYRVLLASTNPGDVVLDPFFGTGTTGAAAKLLHRNWIGIEKDPSYIPIAQKRIEKTRPEKYLPEAFDLRDEKRLAPRVPFPSLLESGYINPGQALFFNKDTDQKAIVKPNGILKYNGFEGSIHQTTKHILNGKPANGWLYWYVQDKKGKFKSIDVIREKYRTDQNKDTGNLEEKSL